MSFKEEMDKRLRRVCGITDDSLKVYTYDRIIDSNWSGDPDDTDFGASHEISVVIYQDDIRIAGKDFEGIAELIRALDKVEL